jgi:hypothetical protein
MVVHACHLSYIGEHKWGIEPQDGLGIKQDPISKITNIKKRLGPWLKWLSTCLASMGPRIQISALSKERKKEKKTIKHMRALIFVDLSSDHPFPTLVYCLLCF